MNPSSLLKATNHIRRFVFGRNLKRTWPKGISQIVGKGEAEKLFLKYGPDSGAILDIGAGMGTFGRSLENTRPKIKVQELDKVGERAVDISKDPLPFEDNSFDAVTAWQVFEHVENPYKAWREIKRVLKPGGIFMMSVPNPGQIESRLIFLLFGELPRWTIRNDHIFVPTYSIVRKKAVKEIGFNWISVEYFLPRFKSCPNFLRKIFGYNSIYIFQKPNHQKSIENH